MHGLIDRDHALLLLEEAFEVFVVDEGDAALAGDAQLLTLVTRHQPRGARLPPRRHSQLTETVVRASGRLAPLDAHALVVAAFFACPAGGRGRCRFHGRRLQACDCLMHFVVELSDASLAEEEALGVDVVHEGHAALLLRALLQARGLRDHLIAMLIAQRAAGRLDTLCIEADVAQASPGGRGGT